MKFVGLTENTILLTKGAFSFAVSTISSKRCLLITFGSGSIVPKQGVLQRD